MSRPIVIGSIVRLRGFTMKRDARYRVISIHQDAHQIGVRQGQRTSHPGFDRLYMREIIDTVPDESHGPACWEYRRDVMRWKRGQR